MQCFSKILILIIFLINSLAERSETYFCAHRAESKSGKNFFPIPQKVLLFENDELCGKRRGSGKLLRDFKKCGSFFCRNLNYVLREAEWNETKLLRKRDDVADGSKVLRLGKGVYFWSFSIARCCCFSNIFSSVSFCLRFSAASRHFLFGVSGSSSKQQALSCSQYCAKILSPVAPPATPVFVPKVEKPSLVPVSLPPAPYKSFIPYPFAYGAEVVLRIEDVVITGQGLGRIDLLRYRERQRQINATSDSHYANGAFTPKFVYNSLVEEKQIPVHHGNNESYNAAGHSSVPNAATPLQQPNKSKRWVVLVPFTLKGEIVRVRITKNYYSYSEAEPVQLLSNASHARILPLCKYFTICGGCQYQHCNIQTQRQMKRRHVYEVFKQIGKTEVCVEDVIGNNQTFYYRSKITPHFDDAIKGNIKSIGFSMHGRKKQIEVNECSVAAVELNDALPSLYEKTRKRIYNEYTLEKEKRINGETLLLRLTEDGVVFNPNILCREKVGNYTFSFFAGSFFQINKSMLPKLVNIVVTEARKPFKNGLEPTTLIDCYCGVGLFALSANKYFDSVVGVEECERSIQLANKNAIENKIDNCKFVLGKAETIFEPIQSSMFKALRNETTIILDPPRKGCFDSFLEKLIKFMASRIVYVSCNPATQARDSVKLQHAGYTITKVQPLDLFPQTKHIENVVVFELSNDHNHNIKSIHRSSCEK